MDDPLEILSLPNVRLAPNPEFRARLMEVLDEEIEQTQRSAPPNPAPPSPPMVFESADHDQPGERPRLRSFILMVAAAAVIVALTAAVLVRDREESPPPLDEVPTTVPFDPVRAAEVAESMLLEGEEYAPFAVADAFQDVLLDGSLAATVPGCAPFLDAVFEGSGRAAVTDSRQFFMLYPPAMLGEYVVLFSSEAGAEAMFDATVDPRFGDECLQPYFELTDQFGAWCCDPNVAATPALFGEPTVSDLEVGADDMQMRTNVDAFWTDDVGVVHGPEQGLSVTLRVGPAIIVMDAVTQFETGETVISAEQFDLAIANAVSKARTALDIPAD